MVVDEHRGSRLEYRLVAVGLTTAEPVHRELHVLGEERRVQAVEIGVDLTGFDSLYRSPGDRFRGIATEELLHALDIADVLAGTAVGARWHHVETFRLAGLLGRAQFGDGGLVELSGGEGRRKRVRADRTWRGHVDGGRIRGVVAITEGDEHKADSGADDRGGQDQRQQFFQSVAHVEPPSEN